MASALLKTAPPIAGVFPGVVFVMDNTHNRGGYFCIYRADLDHPTIRKSNEHRDLWMLINDLAAWGDSKSSHENKEIILRRGQLTVGRKQLAELLNNIVDKPRKPAISEHKARRMLQDFERAGLVLLHSAADNTLITILTPTERNALAQQTAQQTAQPNEQQIAQPKNGANHCTATDAKNDVGNFAQPNANKLHSKTHNELHTLKEIKENKEYISPLSVGELFEIFWKFYPYKVGRKKAEKEFYRVMGDGVVDAATILAALHDQIEAGRWKGKEQRYRKTPEKWISEWRWEDDPDAFKGEEEEAAPPMRRYMLDEDGNLWPAEECFFDEFGKVRHKNI